MPHTVFDNFGLPPKLLHALTRMKFTTPTPIQAQTIPLALKGQDVLGSAQTGTGKTGAFGIPIIAGLMENPEAAALILTPTRELADQVITALEPMIPTADIRTALLIGGEAMPKQMNQLRHNPRLIVGTPGRINDHLERGSLKLGNVKYLVLDETDRMLDMGFGIQIDRILNHVSKDRQTLLFSATLPANIVKLSGKYMRDPVRVAVGSTTMPMDKIKQEVIPTNDAEKYSRLLEQLDARKGTVIIFVKTKFGTEKLAAKLNKDQHHSDAIHGDLQQRRRNRVIENFRDKKYRILVATDVAARGLDIPHIAHVINYDMPQVPEDYIHRIGRTARAGAEGHAVSFLTGADNAKWRAIQRLMNGEDPNAPAARSGGGGARRGFGSGARKPFWKKDGDRPQGDRPHSDRPKSDRPYGDKPRTERSFGDKPHSDKPHSDKPRSDRPYGDRPKSDKPYGDKPRAERSFGDKPHSDKPRGERPYGDRPKSDKPYGDKPRAERSFGDKPRGDRPYGDRPKSDRPYGDKPRGERPSGDRPHSDKPRGEKVRSDWSPSSRVRSDRPFADRPHSDRPRSDRPHSDRPKSDRPYGDKPRGDRPAGDRPREDRPQRSDQPRGDRPFGKPRSGKPYAGKPEGARPYKGKSAAPRGRG
ncbi:MAG: DEAD/DEAH box helicase [Alphaproteobacteria bacterium]